MCAMIPLSWRHDSYLRNLCLPWEKSFPVLTARSVRCASITTEIIHNILYLTPSLHPAPVTGCDSQLLDAVLRGQLSPEVNATVHGRSYGGSNNVQCLQCNLLCCLFWKTQTRLQLTPQ